MPISCLFGRSRPMSLFCHYHTDPIHAATPAPEGVGPPVPSQCRRPQEAPLAAGALTVRGVPAKFLDQVPRRSGSRDLAVQGFPAVNRGAVHRFVSALVGLHDGAIQADSGKNPFAARQLERKNLPPLIFPVDPTLSATLGTQARYVSNPSSPKNRTGRADWPFLDPQHRPKSGVIKTSAGPQGVAWKVSRMTPKRQV